MHRYHTRSEYITRIATVMGYQYDPLNTKVRDRTKDVMPNHYVTGLSSLPMSKMDFVLEMIEDAASTRTVEVENASDDQRIDEIMNVLDEHRTTKVKSTQGLIQQLDEVIEQ